MNCPSDSHRAKVWPFVEHSKQSIPGHYTGHHVLIAVCFQCVSATKSSEACPQRLGHVTQSLRLIGRHKEQQVTSTEEKKHMGFVGGQMFVPDMSHDPLLVFRTFTPTVSTRVKDPTDEETFITDIICENRLCLCWNHFSAAFKGIVHFCYTEEDIFKNMGKQTLTSTAHRLWKSTLTKTLGLLTFSKVSSVFHRWWRVTQV